MDDVAGADTNASSSDSPPHHEEKDLVEMNGLGLEGEGEGPSPSGSEGDQMQDDDKKQVNRAPMKTDERVVLLSPCIDSWKGKQYAHMPALAGEVPANNIGLAPDHDEVPDRTFRGRNFQESGGGIPARKLAGRGVSKKLE